MKVTRCQEGCVGWDWVFVWSVGGCLSEIWTSGIVYILILTISMSMVCLIWPKPGLSGVWKTLINYFPMKEKYAQVYTLILFTVIIFIPTIQVSFVS